MNSDSTLKLLEKEHIYLFKFSLHQVHFDPVADYIKWKDLFPVWINEKYPSKCPEIQMPRFDDYQELDVILARVPCSRDDEGRDVFRLQVNLVVANLLLRSRRKNNNSSVFAVFTGSCTPMWEIFRCDDLLWHEGNYWVYKPELKRLQQKVLMPVGTCQPAPAILEQGEISGTLILLFSLFWCLCLNYFIIIKHGVMFSLKFDFKFISNYHIMR